MRGGVARGFAVTGAGRTVFAVPGGSAAAAGLAVRDSSVPLTGLVTDAGGGRSKVRLSLSGREAGMPIYFYLTVREVPRTRPVKPEDQGIKVERWYERYDREEPIISVAEGELVRVRLRVTIPEDRQFLVVDDGLPAGLEAIDLSLRTASLSPGPGVGQTTRYLAPQDAESEGGEGSQDRWFYGRWDSGWWSPFDHRELHDERVVYSATVLWRGTYTMTYLARATTPGTFIRPPAHAEEMYNPAVYGRSDGGIFTVTPR
jgi:uncharacterized protein YfaS (alpha-2-macroglobulin family)